MHPFLYPAPSFIVSLSWLMRVAEYRIVDRFHLYKHEWRGSNDFRAARGHEESRGKNAMKTLLLPVGMKALTAARSQSLKNINNDL